MKSKENEKELMVRKGMPSLPTKTMLPPALAERIERYPENKRRPVNKTVFKNDYFLHIYSALS